jgi:hypothetical protein
MVRFVLPALLLGALLAGCGGGTARKPPLSKRALAAKADQICAHALTRTGRLARLRALRPPAGEEDLYAHWLKAEKDALQATKPQHRKPEEPLLDPKVGETVAEGKIAGYARRLGAATCAKRTIATIPP